MARVTYGSEVTELTGSIAGTTFQRNFSGNIVRSKPNKIINPSNLLGTKQLGLSSLVTQWNLLSAAQKTGWNDLAAAHTHTDPWGNVRSISGYQWFLSNNLNLLAINENLIYDAPSYLLPDPPPNYSLLFQATELVIAFISFYDYSPYTLVIYGTPPVRSSSSKSRISVYYIMQWASGSGQNFVINNQYESKFGYSIAQLLSYQNFSIVTRVCVIDPATGFRSTYAINNAAAPLTWEDIQNWNTYPASTNATAFIQWETGITETFNFGGSFTRVHSYADPGYHDVIVGVTWTGGGSGWSGSRLGSVGTVTVNLESTPP